jgi:subtilase family serine protease
VVDRTTGAFYASPTPSRSQKIGVRFSVENLGTKTSPQFDFTAVLPTNPATTFQSPTVQGLLPGQKTEFVMGFEGYTMSGNSLTITVDPLNRFTESNKSNNVAYYTITTTQ